MKILVVDDELSIRHTFTKLLASVEGAEYALAESREQALAEAKAKAFDLAFVDINLGGSDRSNRDGLEVLRVLRESTATFVVMVTGSHDMVDIRAAIRGGAFDYVLKEDLCREVVVKIADDVRQQRRLEREVIASRVRAGATTALDKLVGASKGMEQLRAMIQRVAVSDRPVLVLGPSGAGKEEVARALHALGPSPDADLFDLNCSALPAELFESTLFGHEKGAFSGAVAKSEGYLAAVGKGTLFLDELGEMPLALQAKLLRVLETGKFRSVGGVREREFQGRVVAATNADLAERVRQGKFREDLFHRLDVLRIRVPPLDERREDIPALVAHFASRQRPPLRFSEDAVRLLQLAPWPGNVRQLRNLVDRVAVFCEDDPVTAASLRQVEALDDAPRDDDLFGRMARLVLSSDVENKLATMENALVDEAMRQANGNKSQAARLLGVHRKVVERRVNGGDDQPPSAA